MNIQTRLDDFRNDNPYDIDTQAKRLLATNDTELVLHVLALGLAAAKQRQRHIEREYIKNVGRAPPKERLVSGRVTGAVIAIPVKPSPRLRNAAQQLIVDVWRVGGELQLGDATGNDLAVAINRENSSATGHKKNASFYALLKEKLDPTETVRTKWDEKSVRKTIEAIYGEFRKSEAA